jgi:UDP-N-acetylglucosamine 2-epimerase (non-hydrolysing)
MIRRSVMVVFGTRPEAIKLAPVILALSDSPLLDSTVVVTGQHREMLDSVLATFEITPQHDLDIIQDRQSLADVTVRTIQRLSPLLEGQRPDVVLVQGDTTTTFAGALTAFYHKVPVVHLEAGLRTSDAASPFPEEINRRLTTQVATLHLAPTWASRSNLLRENIPPDRILVTGNTVIDAMLWALRHEPPEPSSLVDWLETEPRRILLVTAHRRESWGRPLESIGRALSQLARSEPDLLIVLPIHRNPIVRNTLGPALGSVSNVVLTEPLPYAAFVRLLACSDFVLTDSGGIQEEAPGLGKPVLIMRDTTERIEAVEAGTARLVGTDEHEIVRAVQRLLHDQTSYLRMVSAVNPYGDGQAVRRAVAAVTNLVGLGPRPDDFRPS